MNDKSLPIHESNSLGRIAAYRVCDVASFFLALAIASQFGQRLYLEQFLVSGLTATLVYLLTSEVTGNFRAWRGSTYSGEVVTVWGTWVVTSVVLVLLGALVQYGSGLTRFSFGLWFFCTAALLMLVRCSLRMISSYLYSRGFNTRGFAIVGITDIGIQLAKNIDESPQLGMEFLGFFDDRLEDRSPALPKEFGTRIGNISELVDATRRGDISTIYITFPMRAEDRIRYVLSVLADTTASVYVVPDFFVFELLHSRWNNIQGIPVVSIFENPFYGIDGLLKRTLDVVISLAMMLVCAIPMLIVALLVKLTSPGPVLFRQKRYGLDGREIPVWKFRSMRVMENGAKVTQATKNDPRVTKVGAFIRKTSLDELPQLFNVLCGDMSLVGPRPHATAHNEEYRKRIHGYMLRHKVKPGITGLAQVEGCRGETDTLEKMEKRVQFDHRYIREWSFWLDIHILFKTLFVVLKKENAY